MNIRFGIENGEGGKGGGCRNIELVASGAKTPNVEHQEGSGLSLLTSAVTILGRMDDDEDENEGRLLVTKSGFDCKNAFVMLPDLFC